MTTKLSQKMRNKTRTGQYMGPPPGSYGTPLEMTPSRTPAYNPGGNGGACGPQGPTVPMSWGSACPTGDCTSENLATSLGRANAGERYGCRELSYWLTGVSTAGGLLTLSENAKVTICPTRIIADEALGGVIPGLAVMSVFQIGNQNQIAGDPLPLTILALGSYQSIPFVTDCIKAGLPFSISLSGLDAATRYFIGLIGPAIG